MHNDVFLFANGLIFGLIHESWMCMFAFVSNLFRYFIFVDVYDKNPISQKWSTQTVFLI